MEIVHATPTDTDAVAELVGSAFHDLDVARWLIDDPNQRAKVLPANFAIYVEHAMAHGEIHLAGDEPVAVAVWFHQDRELAPPPPADYDTRLQAACGRWVDRFRELDAAFDAHHPHDRPAPSPGLSGHPS